MIRRLLTLTLLLVGFLCTAAEAQEAPVPIPIDSGGLIGLFFPPPAGAVSAPAVLVLGGSEGGLAPAVTEEARLIAQHGMGVLQLAYFGMNRLPESLQLIPVEYFMRAIAWLGRQPGVDPRRIAVVGTSVGGEAALLIAAHDPTVRAVVAAVPSGIVWQGLGVFGQKDPASSFTWGGSPLPDLPHRSGQNASFFDRYSAGLAALGRYRNALIPVAQIHGPVLLVCGWQDVIWPSCRMSRMVLAALDAAHFLYPAKLLAFPRAGHAVFGPPLAPTDPAWPALGALGGTAAANNAARMVDWPAFFAFLDSALDDRPDKTKLGLASR